VINPEPQTIDAELERRIDFEAGLLAIAQTPAEQLSAWEELKRLVAQRSPERVAQMERAMGIR
jgi:hypothetical protein